MWQKNYYATCHNLGPSLTIIIDDGNQYFENNNNYVKKSLWCHVSYFNRWMTLNDVNITSWV
jgi:hypothetical protein